LDKRSGSTATVLAALAAGLIATSAGAQGGPRFGVHSGEDTYDGFRRHSVYVPMTDQTRIAVDYYLPTAKGVEATGKLPVVLHYTRYGRAVEDGKGGVHTKVDDFALLQHLLRHGYAVAVADSRGTGASFGTRGGDLSAQEDKDSADIIGWVAAQPWSNGKVGMQGRSYPGVTQYHAATMGAPALKAIFAEMAVASPYDWLYTGGTYKKDFVDNWSGNQQERDLKAIPPPARVDADTDGKLRDQAVAEHRGNSWITGIVSSPQARFRDFVDSGPKGTGWSWKQVETVDNADAIRKSGVAIYHVAGWYDLFVVGQTAFFGALDGIPQKLLVGPWVHGGGVNGALLQNEILRWYDYWLKGIDNGIMKEEPVHYYLMRSNHTQPAQAGGPTVDSDETRADDGSTWTASKSWPPAGISSQRWFFGAPKSGTIASLNDGALVESKAAGSDGKDDYTVDYSSTFGSLSRWMIGYGYKRPEAPGNTLFDERSAEDKKNLTYTTEALRQPISVTGTPMVHLWVSSQDKDADFFVYLEEIDERGAAHYVSEGAIRASYRKTGPAPYKGLPDPYHPSLAGDVADLVPGQPTELVLDLMPTAIVIDAGHRLRVSITGVDRRDNAIYPDPAGKNAPKVSILRGGGHASFVDLPVTAAPSVATSAR